MDSRHIIGARVADSDSLQAKSRRMLVHGVPIITTGKQDPERLEYELRQQHRSLTDDIKRFRVEENHGRRDGLLEQWRRRDVEVYGIPRVPRGEPRIVCGQHQARDWQLELADDDSTPITVSCAPEDFETIIKAFLENGFPVVWAEDLTRPPEEARPRSLALGQEDPWSE